MTTYITHQDNYNAADQKPLHLKTIPSPSTEQKVPLSGEEQERKITTYEEAMNKIKDATGVSDIQVHSASFCPFTEWQLVCEISKWTKYAYITLSFPWQFE